MSVHGTDIIRVLLADDHPMVLVGISGMLDAFNDLELVGNATNGNEAISLCKKLQPDVILMDIMMPNCDGIEATRTVRSTFPGVKVLALSSFDDPRAIDDALEAGASGYMRKNVGAHELANAIRATHRTAAPLVPAQYDSLIDSSKLPSIGQDLTPREHEVLFHLALGLNNAEIAEELVVSPFTVKNHVSNILAKLNASSRTEAAALAVQYRLIKLPRQQS